MALLWYSKQRDGLPNPKGSLSLAIPLPAISMVNCIVTEAMTGGKKRGPYKKYSLEERCRIGHRAVATSWGVGWLKDAVNRGLLHSRIFL